MIKKQLFTALLFVMLSVSCKSQSLLPSSDIYEIEKSKSILSTYTCEDLIEKANDSSFSLKNLAAIRAVARCPEFKFDFTRLTDLEQKLYANEIESFNMARQESRSQDLSAKEIKSLIKKEKDQLAKFRLYKQLRGKYRLRSDRKELKATITAMYKWALQNQKKQKKDSETASTILYESAQLAARFYFTDDEGAAASNVVDESLARLRKGSVAELLFIKGRIFEEAKKSADAVAEYDLILKDIEKYSPKNLSFGTDRVLWLKAWILYKEKNYAAAEVAFAALADNTVELSERSRAQFYRARSLRMLTRTEEARLIFESITQNDFFGYYGLVSYRELGKKLPALSTLKSNNTIPYDLNLSFLPETERSLYKDLIKYREYAIAERSLGLISKSKQDETNLTLYLAQKAKIFMPLFRVFGKLSNDEKMNLFINYTDLVFPRPYRDQVDEMAVKTKLPSSLIYSIMKQESGFNEKARSGADAMGLMQVVPSLARQLSRKFEVPYRANNDLFDPLINIQLGSYELMEQVRRQNGQLTFVAAAYNAGPGALSSWLKNRKRDDVLEFIEEIPYDETRTYVKLIARNKLFYERISNRDSEHDFPPDFLN